MLFLGSTFPKNVSRNGGIKATILKVLATINLVFNKKTILNFFYNISKKRYLNVQGVSEYSKLEVI
jgi:hypothetical protein